MTDTTPALVIDSHVHFWDPAERTYPWLKDERLARAFGPNDLAPLLDETGVTTTILVQTLPDLDETRGLLHIAADCDDVAGVVGWVDLTDPQLAMTLEELQSSPNGTWLAGVRHQIEDEQDDAWLGHEDVQHGLSTIADAGLVYDFLVRPQHLPFAMNIAEDFPHLRFVIDHMAKPNIADGEIDEWNAAIHEFAGMENVACKLSGILNGAGENWTVDDLRPYVRSVVEVFGPHRLMFGSDWPISLIAADYPTTIRTLRETLDGLDLTDDDLAAIFGRTAVHWYGLKVPSEYS